jgi:hypothetical protein
MQRTEQAQALLEYVEVSLLSHHRFNSDPSALQHVAVT